MCSAGIASSAGVGKIISELVTYGESANDIRSTDVRRHFTSANNKFYLRDKVSDTLSYHYELLYPKMQFDSCRNIRNSSLHGLLDISGAVWGEYATWERPDYFKFPDQSKI